MADSDTPAGGCLACESRRVKPYVSGGVDRKRAVDRDFLFYRCSDCGLRFQVVPENDARTLYDVQDKAACKCAVRRGELRCEDDVLRAFAALGPGRRILDVGSGDGHFLAAARRAGLDCVGVDVSPRLAEVARRRSGATVLVGTVDELDLPKGVFDYINLDSVLMYVPDPRGLFLSIAALLRPGGFCRVREFDPGSLSARAAGRGYWMYSPTHVSVWTVRGVRAAAGSAGLRLARLYPGTEASFGNWVATGRGLGRAAAVRDAAMYCLRKVRLPNLSLFADTAYYFQKP